MKKRIIGFLNVICILYSLPASRQNSHDKCFQNLATKRLSLQLVIHHNIPFLSPLKVLLMHAILLRAFNDHVDQNVIRDGYHLHD